jgi:hypothetical protein
LPRGSVPSRPPFIAVGHSECLSACSAKRSGDLRSRAWMPSMRARAASRSLPASVSLMVTRMCRRLRALGATEALAVHEPEDLDFGIADRRRAAGNPVEHGFDAQVAADFAPQGVEVQTGGFEGGAGRRRHPA